MHYVPTINNLAQYTMKFTLFVFCLCYCNVAMSDTISRLKGGGEDRKNFKCLHYVLRSLLPKKMFTWWRESIPQQRQMRKLKKRDEGHPGTHSRAISLTRINYWAGDWVHSNRLSSQLHVVFVYVQGITTKFSIHLRTGKNCVSCPLADYLQRYAIKVRGCNCNAENFFERPNDLLIT